MGQLTIRDAQPHEYDAMLALTLAAYAQYAADMPAAMWEGYQANMQQTLTTAGTFARIVAFDDTTLVGSVLLFPQPPNEDAEAAVVAEPPIPEVRLLAVAPTARGHGVGVALMQECAQRARQRGAPAIGLHTMDFMQSAVRLYGRLGYQRVPETDFYPAPDFVVKGYRLSLVAAASA